MKIEINNLGPIKNFKINLNKNLHLIYGKNSVGKSYAISAVYLIGKNIISGQANNINNTKFYQKLINKIEHKIRDNNFRTYPIPKKYIYPYVKKSLNSFVQNLENSFNNSFPDIKNLTNKLNSEEFSIKIKFGDIEFKIKITNNKLYISDIIKFPNKISIKFTNSNRLPYLNSEGRTIISINKNEYYDTSFKTPLLFMQQLDNIIFALVNKNFIKIKEKYNNIYFLPASRSGLYIAMNTFSSLLVELSQQRQFISKSISLPDISEPVSDYFLNVSKINPENKSNLIDIVKKIENEILNGKVGFDIQTKKLKFQQNDIDLQLDLKEASSMVAEISPIVAHLKYILKYKNKTSILFIEELESHLHPDIQVKVMKIFTELAEKFNLKLILTSHSNYMFNKLNNIILDNKNISEITSSYHLMMTKRGSIDKKDMNVTNEGIADENFAKTSKELYNERINIYEKLNQE